MAPRPPWIRYWPVNGSRYENRLNTHNNDGCIKWDSYQTDYSKKDLQDTVNTQFSNTDGPKIVKVLVWD